MVFFAGCQSKKIDKTLLVGPAEPVSFANDILPIWINSCGGSSCHVGESTSGVDLTSYTSTLSSLGTQYDTTAIIPADALNSPIMDKLRDQPQHGIRMPIDMAPLPVSEILLIESWINDGAPNN